MNIKGAYKKKAINIENIKARFALLVDGINFPDRINSSVVESLASQRSFAALNIEKTLILSLAFNTMSKLAKEVYAKEHGQYRDGFAYFDSYRIKLYEILETRTGARTLEAKTKRLTESAEQTTTRLRNLELQNILCLKAYSAILVSINTFVTEKIIDDQTRKGLINILEDHRDLYHMLLTPKIKTNACGDNVVFPLIPKSILPK